MQEKEESKLKEWVEKNKKPIEDYYGVLYRLEIKLRQLMERELVKVSQNWWTQRVPPYVRKNAEDRKRRDRRLPYQKTNLPPIYYISFSDYIEIIARGDNWTQVFEPIFKDKRQFKAKLKELKPIRNYVMHPKPLGRDERDTLAMNSEYIVMCVEKWEIMNSRYVNPAREHIQKREYEIAEKLLRDGLKKTKTEDKPFGDGWIAYHLGVVCKELRKFEEAKKWYEYAEITLLLPQYREMAREGLRQVQRVSSL